MPQKKNPDALELLRGKAGRTIGHTVGLLTTLKGLPTAYNKDMQEDKQALFDNLETAEAALQIAQGVLATLTPNETRMRNALNSFMLATDLSEYLVRKGVPFRETHHISGRAVQMAEDRGCALTDLSVADLKSLHNLFEDDVRRTSHPHAAHGRTWPHTHTHRTACCKPRVGSFRATVPPVASMLCHNNTFARSSRPATPPRYGPDCTTPKGLKATMASLTWRGPFDSLSLSLLGR